MGGHVNQGIAAFLITRRLGVQTNRNVTPYNQRWIGNSIEEGTRFHQGSQKNHLLARWPFCGAHPIPVCVVDGSIARIGKLPNGVMAIANAASAGKDGTIMGLEEKTVLVQIADNVKVKYEKSAIASITRSADGEEKA